MKSFFVCGLRCALSVGLLAGVAQAQTMPYGSPSVLPLPQANYNYPATAPPVYAQPNPAYQQHWQASQTPQSWQQQRFPAVAPTYSAAAMAPPNNWQAGAVPAPHWQTQAAPGGNWYANNTPPMGQPHPAVDRSVLPRPAPQHQHPHVGGQHGHGHPHAHQQHGNHQHHGSHHHHAGPGYGYPAPGSDYYPSAPQPGYPGNCASGNCGGNNFYDAMAAPWDGGGYGCGPDGSCGYGAVGGYAAPAFQAGWFASAAGLIMSRDTANPYYFSYFALDEPAQRLDARDVVQWGGGVEFHLGTWLTGCGCGGGFGGIGVEGVYWGLYPQDGETTLTNTAGPGSLNAILNFNQLNYNGLQANMSTDNAMIHRLRGGYEVHNAEINILGGGLNTAYWDAPVQFTWLAGFRYFRFDESLEFASDPTDMVFSGAAPEIFYNVDVENNLYGFQLGGRSVVYIIPRVGLDIGTKFGVFGNHIEHRQRIGGSAGDAVINNGAFTGRAFNISSEGSDIALLGEFKAGLNVRLTPNWSILGGYRAVAVSNIALTTNQIPMDLRGINDVAAVDSNGSLILHGAYAGAEFIW